MLSFFPPAQWLRHYKAAWLRYDLVAGLTLAAYAIPVSLAYATLAGLPPHYGIYCYLVAGPAYALFGTSRQLAVGPTSAISMLIGATLAGMTLACFGLANKAEAATQSCVRWRIVRQVLLHWCSLHKASICLVP